MHLLLKIRKFKKSFSNYHPLITITIYKAHLLHNLEQYRKMLPGINIAPVLKSNAYGHGLLEIAEILDKQDIAFLVVDSLFEAMALRNGGIRSKLLVIGYTTPENIARCHLKNVAFTITSLDQLRNVSSRKDKHFHLKIDTGMNRQGIEMNEIFEAIRIIKSNNKIVLEGVCSHFADADGEDEAFTREQMKKWEEAVEIFKIEFPGLRYTHIAATAGARLADETSANTVRLGLGLYGIEAGDAPDSTITVQSGSFEPAQRLRPVLEMRTVVSGVRLIEAGEYVGYGKTYQAKQPMKIAAVPAGYFEGIDRRLSNQGFFKIKGQFCPIIGRISMNISTADVSLLPEVALDDEAVIISASDQDVNSVQNIAKICETIPYEILVHIPAHLRRVVV